MIGDLSSFALFLTASCGMVLTGRVLLSHIRFYLTAGERLVWSFILGALTISLAFTILGFAGFFTRTIAFVILFLTLSTALYRPRPLLKEIIRSGKSLKRFVVNHKKPEYVIGLIVFAALAITFILVAVAPELRYDALQYHLELPKRYINAGRITFQHDILQSAFPQAWGMLYSYGLLLGSARIAKLFAFSAGVCVLISAYSAGRRFFGKSAGFFSALVTAATPVFCEYWSNAMADIPFMLLLAMAALTLVYGRKSLIQASVVSGLFLGFAAASRMQTLVLAPAIFVVFLFTIASLKPGLKRGAIALVILFGIAIALNAPWYIHNYVATGSITGYFVTDVSRYEEWRTASNTDSLFSTIKQFLVAGNFRGPRGPWYTKLLIPFRLTFEPNIWGQGVPGPLYLALLPGVFFVRKRFKNAAFLLGIVFITVLAWILLLKETNVRYLAPAIFPGAVAAGYVWSLYLRSGRVGRLIAWLILVFTAGSAAFFVKQVSEYFPYSLGLKKPEELVVNKTFSGFNAITAVNSLPEGSLVLTNDGRTFYFDTPVIMGRPRHNHYFNSSEIETPREMLKWFEEHGVTHVLAVSGESDFTFPGKPFGNPEGKYRFREDFLDVYGTVTAEGGRRNRNEYYELYEMHYTESENR
jgi:hypothetical protein